MAEVAALAAAGGGAGAGAGAVGVAGTISGVSLGSALTTTGATTALVGQGAAIGAGLAGAAATAAVIGATGTTVALGLSQAQSAKNVADAQSRQAQINASQIAESNKINQDLERRRSIARRGALEGRIGASGLTRSGSALSLIADELFTSQLNEALVLSRGGQAVTQQQNISNTIRAQGRADRTAGRLGAVTSGILVGSQSSQLLR